MGSALGYNLVLFAKSSDAAMRNLGCMLVKPRAAAASRVGRTEDFLNIASSHMSWWFHSRLFLLVLSDMVSHVSHSGRVCMCLRWSQNDREESFVQSGPCLITK